MVQTLHDQSVIDKGDNGGELHNVTSGVVRVGSYSMTDKVWTEHLQVVGHASKRKSNPNPQRPLEQI